MGRTAVIRVDLAQTSADIDAARALCKDWLVWHWENYPPDWPSLADHPMDPEKYHRIIEDLPELHARPQGGILVASVNGVPAGCVMYSQAQPGVAQFNRMFVGEHRRGFGLGRLLLDRMFAQMIADGYEKVRFSSARFLTHARAMYEKAGFWDVPHPDGFPMELRDKIYFMERSLQ